MERLRDRIEALERDTAEDADRIVLLEQHAKNQKTRIEALEKALREIVALDTPENWSRMCTVSDAAAIARDALKVKVGALPQ